MKSISTINIPINIIMENLILIFGWQTGLPFTSKHEGCMHACGHDNHAAMLLGSLHVLNEHKDELLGNVKFVFQTGEEISKGAKVAIQEGVLDGVDAVFGTHIGSILSPDIPAGTFIVIPGCCMASFDRFILKVRGVGCHGSTPEKGVDPITIASNIVLSLQEVIVREIAAPNASDGLIRSIIKRCRPRRRGVRPRLCRVQTSERDGRRKGHSHGSHHERILIGQRSIILRDGVVIHVP